MRVVRVLKPVKAWLFAGMQTYILSEWSSYVSYIYILNIDIDFSCPVLKMFVIYSLSNISFLLLVSTCWFTQSMHTVTLSEGNRERKQKSGSTPSLRWVLGPDTLLPPRSVQSAEKPLSEAFFWCWGKWVINMWYERKVQLVEGRGFNKPLIRL